MLESIVLDPKRCWEHSGALPDTNMVTGTTGTNTGTTPHPGPHAQNDRSRPLSGEERAGDADLEANTAIKESDLCSCNPYLRSAHTLELLNAMELADVLYSICISQ